MNGVTAGGALVTAAAVLVAAGLGYLGRVRLPRPPIGVYRWSDVAFMSAAIVLAPVVYLSVPVVVAGAVFACAFVSAVQLGLAPLTGARRATLVALAAGATELLLARVAPDVPLRIVHGLVLALALVGVTNLWVQSGMRASHVAGLATVLTLYDVYATVMTSTSEQLMQRLMNLPFAPMLAITGGPVPVALGLGDCLMLLLWPLAARRSFGRRAGVTAAVLGVGLLAAVQTAFTTGVLSGTVPFLTLLGPLIAVQFLVWRRRYGRERTVGEWRRAETATVPAPGPDSPPATLGAPGQVTVAARGS